MPEPENEGATAVPPAPAAPAAAPRQAPRRLPRAVGVALATAGLLAVTAASAAVTVAVGKPAARPATAAPAPSKAAASASATASATPSAAPVPVPTAAPAEPAPASTVKGTVSGGRHEGDLRYFLLPIPAGGESYGPVDGVTMTDDDVAAVFGKQDGIMDILKSYGYKGGATRMYRTADGKAEVTVTLLKFGSTAMAGDFVRNYRIKSMDPFDIDGDQGGRGYLKTPKQQAYTGSMTGISSQGDVQYTIDVDVKGTPDKALLNELMKRQREWLTTGG
ncbi:hypothetical protein [Kitasatospora sp. NPDC001547]|uniref:hypothetical protein n=1 Tax=Kitasatospora sp. NPDC001547 TaxID=3364015 RepID=UPI0036C1CE1D|nr:hypothetical protein KitaXyl93_72840 [Kitasatospora sp. Xyl93]